MYARYSYPLGRMQLVFRKSLDRGATWTGEVVVDNPTVMRTLRLVVNQSDDLFAIWSLGTDVRMVISRDDGAAREASFDFDQQTSSPTAVNDGPVICSGNSIVSVVWRSNNGGGSILQVLTRTSADGGVTFGPGTSLRTPTTTSANVPDVECNGSEVLAVWADFRDTTLIRTWSNRFNGLSWQGERAVAAGLNRNQFIPRVIYALGPSATQPLVIFTATTRPTRFARPTAERTGGRLSASTTSPRNRDGDGVLSGSDCNDADPNVRGAPTEIAGVTISRVGPASRIAWISQDATADSSTNYDIVTGDLAALVSSRGFTAATCLVDNDADTPFDDSSARPAPGGGAYYLVRGQHACTGTHGDSGQAVDPRDALDLSGPCR